MQTKSNSKVGFIDSKAENATIEKPLPHTKATGVIMPLNDDAIIGNSLSAEEREDRKRHEATINRGLKTFKEVGSALMAIHDGKLYRDTHNSFGDYTSDVFRFGRSKAYRLMAGTDVLRSMSPIGDTFPDVPESVLRPLMPLEPASRRQTWQLAIEATKGKCPTAQIVKQAIARMKSPDGEVITPRHSTDSQRAELDAEPEALVTATAVLAEPGRIEEPVGVTSEPAAPPPRQDDDFVLADNTAVPYAEWKPGLIPEDRIRCQLSDLSRHAATSKSPGILAVTVTTQKLTFSFAVSVNRTMPAPTAEMVALLPDQITELCRWAVEEAGSRINNIIRTGPLYPRPQQPA